MYVTELMPAYGSEWSLGYLWRRTDGLERFVLILLALMLISVVAIVTDFWHRYRLAAAAERINPDNPTRRKMGAQLGLNLRALRSIFVTAPCLGLVGSCSGILSTFTAYSGSRAGFVLMVASGIEAALLSTAAGILVAVAATGSYNWLCTRMDLLESRMHDARLPVRARFSTFPFSAITASVLAISLAAFMIFPSFHVSKGLTVRVLKIGALEGKHLSGTVITIGPSKTNTPPVVYVNSKKTASGEMEKELRTELQARPVPSITYVQAEDNILWRDVVNVIDAAQGVHTDVILLTTTPAAH